MSTDAERDPVEWAQRTALVAISVARTVLDLVEAAVADRERIERLATSGRSVADTWLTDAIRLANTVAAGFGLPTDAPVAAPPAARPPTAARAAAPTASTRSATKSAKKPRPKPAKKVAKRAAPTRKVKRAAPTRKVTSPRPKKRTK